MTHSLIFGAKRDLKETPKWLDLGSADRNLHFFNFDSLRMISFFVVQKMVSVYLNDIPVSSSDVVVEVSGGQYAVL